MTHPLTESDQRLFTYNCLDVCRTWEVWQGEQRQMERMAEGWPALPEVDEFQQGLFEPVLWSMERGIRVDLAQRKRVAQQLALHIEELEKDLEVMFGHPLNVNSPKQMKQFFFGDLKQPLTFSRATKKKGKTVSLGKEQLWRVASREPLLALLVKTLLEMRSVKKFLKSFVLAPLDADGRMRTFLNVSGTWTFRMSSRKNAFFTGCNMQTIPKGDGEFEDEGDE